MSCFLEFERISECLRLSKAIQKTCETLQTVANLYDGHVRCFPIPDTFFVALKLGGIIG